jgi:hypothetical protein
MDDHINPDWLAVYRSRAHAKLRGRAKETGLSVDEYVSQAERNIRQWVSGAGVRIRTREPGLVEFLRCGVYKVMSNTHASGGDLQSVERRREVEKSILGISLDASPVSRPVSAYLEGSDETGGITTYGEIVLELVDDVRVRSWFLLGDLVDTPTLGGGQVICPRPLEEPTIEAASGWRDVASAKSMADVCLPHRYAEVLVFDGLTVADVAKITYPHALRPSEEALELCEGADWELR